MLASKSITTTAIAALLVSLFVFSACKEDSTSPIVAENFDFTKFNQLELQVSNIRINYQKNSVSGTGMGNPYYHSDTINYNVNIKTTKYIYFNSTIKDPIVYRDPELNISNCLRIHKNSNTFGKSIDSIKIYMWIYTSRYDKGESWYINQITLKDFDFVKVSDTLMAEFSGTDLNKSLSFFDYTEHSSYDGGMGWSSSDFKTLNTLPLLDNSKIMLKLYYHKY
jgi:hypothetical protein